MPEANVLYAVTALVVAGLVIWVAVVLKTAKEPWSRQAPAPAGIAGAVEAKEGELPPSSSLPKVIAGSATGSADATTDATAVVIGKKSEPKEKAAAEEKLESTEEKLGEDDAKKKDET